MKLNIQKIKENIPVLVFSVLIILIFIVSFVVYKQKQNTEKRVFIFPSVESGVKIVETRYLPENPHQGKLQIYIEEMLLGSQTERTKNLFTAGTKVNSCFERNGTLYLDLSDDLIQMGEGVVSIREGFELLKFNIKKNFSEIKDIQVFVQGNTVYEDRDFNY